MHELERTFQHPIFAESSFLEQNRETAAAVQRYTATLNEFLAFAKMSLDDLKLLAKLDEMVVEMLEHMYFLDTVTELEITFWQQSSSSGGFKISPIFSAPHERSKGIVDQHRVCLGALSRGLRQQQ